VLTAAVTAALVAVGAALVWLAWLASQDRLGSRPERFPALRAAAGPAGVTGGVVVLAGLAVGVSGIGSVPGQVAAGLGALALVVGGAVTALAAARGTGSAERRTR
jgi:hypothetical protein